MNMFTISDIVDDKNTCASNLRSFIFNSTCNSIGDDQFLNSVTAIFFDRNYSIDIFKRKKNAMVKNLQKINDKKNDKKKISKNKKKNHI